MGNGIDVHAFGVGTEITLCGVKIPFNKSLIGHSDADVGLHAIADSIFGALGLGDIGFWFPPTDQKWKNANSEIFLQKATEMAILMKYKICNIDTTFICEKPKIGPYREEMRQRVSDIAKINLNRISIKATTSERLGFTGREEGILCQSTCSLLKND